MLLTFLLNASSKERVKQIFSTIVGLNDGFGGRRTIECNLETVSPPGSEQSRALQAVGE